MNQKRLPLAEVAGYAERSESKQFWDRRKR